MKFGFILLTYFLLLGIFGPIFLPQSGLEMNLDNRFLGPSLEHLFGTDGLGMDIFTTLAFGARVSLLISLSVVGICSVLGLIIGSASGYLEGTFDRITMRVIDTLYSFPGFVLALVIMALLGQGVGQIIFALSITGWTGFARLVRGEVLRLKSLEFVQAARACGAMPVQIVTGHIWPNVYSILMVQITTALSGTLIAEAGLSFLGLGVPSESVSWGVTLSAGRRYLVTAPHISFFAGLYLVGIVFSFFLIGEGLRRRFNPKS